MRSLNRSVDAQEAKKLGKAPDFFYCKSLLEATGVITVPGSGFKQVCAAGSTEVPDRGTLRG